MLAVAVDKNMQTKSMIFNHSFTRDLPPELHMYDIIIYIARYNMSPIIL